MTLPKTKHATKNIFKKHVLGGTKEFSPANSELPQKEK